MNWSGQQAQALDRIGDWIRAQTKQVFYLAGYAGTGKTTIASHILQTLSGLVLVAAFTGKAASVLRRKGCPQASTLHRILYSVTDADRTKLRELEATLKAARDVVPEDEEEAEAISVRIKDLELEIKRERARLSGPRFSVNPESVLKDASLLILDECSMVDQRLGEDVLRFGKPVLVIGDPAQLPPVYGTGYFTSNTPDITLTEIHRQARDNPIIRTATDVREGKRIPYGDWGEVRHIPRRDIDARPFVTSRVEIGSQILCGKNQVRRAINRDVRRGLGMDKPYPLDGETLVILRNDSEIGVLNGVTCKMVGDAEPDPDGDCFMANLYYESQHLPFVPLDRVPFDIYLDPSLEEGWSPALNRHLCQADWGYALTVHKAQGSEWSDVTLWDDGFGARSYNDLRRKWLYTGVTRAADRLTIISGERRK